MKTKTEQKNIIEPSGIIKTYHRGYGWLPEKLRKELNATEPTEIPYILDANCAILLRKGVNQQDILNGLSALIHHLSAKWRIPEEEVRKILSWLPEKKE